MTYQAYGGIDVAMTQEEVAEALGVSPATAHYIEKRALAKLRAALEKRNLKAEDLLLEGTA